MMPSCNTLLDGLFLHLAFIFAFEKLHVTSRLLRR